ncbi:MAG: hypothetical protein HQL69_15400 [Magnetococcales bacterium]|nr:hypothetical protein [Magnetococcales bacterium]
MSETTDLALRIGLAARILDSAGPEPVINTLEAYVGFPFTLQKFQSLEPVKFSFLLERFKIPADSQTIKVALDTLQNGLKNRETPLNMAYEAPVKKAGFVRVGLASNNDGVIDGHFGSCKRFLVYDVSLSQIVHVGTRYTAHLGMGKSMDTEKTRQRVGLISDCNIFCVQSIGGPPAARLVNSGIMPLKYPDSQPLEQVLKHLQARLQNPPPWMKKSMGVERQLAK